MCTALETCILLGCYLRRICISPKWKLEMLEASELSTGYKYSIAIAKLIWMLTIDSFSAHHTGIVGSTGLQLTLLKCYHSYSRTSSSLIKVSFFNVLCLFRDVLARRPVVTHASNPSKNEQCEENPANSNGGNWIHGFMTWPLASNGAEVILWALRFSCFFPRWMAVECWINHAYKEVSSWRATGNWTMTNQSRSRNQQKHSTRKFR